LPACPSQDRSAALYYEFPLILLHIELLQTPLVILKAGLIESAHLLTICFLQIDHPATFAETPQKTA
jgi:hypothetical protein